MSKKEALIGIIFLVVLLPRLLYILIIAVNFPSLNLCSIRHLKMC